MGAVLAKFFVDVETLPQDGYGFIQLLFVGGCYAYILCISSNMIKDGSELLLLIPKYAGVVGSIVLPVLGAVPDGAIVIFSGLGPDAQQQVSVGIGALAGSTIMLLTVPWCLSLVAGRVNLDAGGNGNYVKPSGAQNWSKLMPAGRWAGTGVTVGPAIKYTSKVMILTLISFLVIQIPAFAGKCGTSAQVANNDCVSPKIAALVGALLASGLFVFYLWDQSRLANQDEVKEDKIDQLRQAAVKNGLLTLRGLFPDHLMDAQGEVPVAADSARFRAFLRPFFKKFDTDNSGTIDRAEFASVVAALGETPDKGTLDKQFAHIDADGSGQIDLPEFAAAMADLLRSAGVCAPPTVAATGAAAPLTRTESGAAPARDEEGEDDEEEDAEMPEDLVNLSPAEQQSRLLRRSCWQMGVGVLVVLLISDPMVDVLSELGSRTGIKPFYVAFVLAPLASNASELIAAYAYALKKTEKTMTISLSSLLGAACMNNTFCLALFLFLVYGRDLRWEFSAETLTILLVELVIFVFAQRRTHKTWYGFAILALFPISVLFVAMLELAGLD